MRKPGAPPARAPRPPCCRERPEDSVEQVDARPKARSSIRAVATEVMARTAQSEDPQRLDQNRIPPYTIAMTHTIAEKTKLLRRVRRIKGQVEAVERALEAEIGCADILMLVASLRGAINGLTAELMEEHIVHHVIDPARETDPDRARGATELIEVVRTYLK